MLSQGIHHADDKEEIEKYEEVVLKKINELEALTYSSDVIEQICLGRKAISKMGPKREWFEGRHYDSVLSLGKKAFSPTGKDRDSHIELLDTIIKHGRAQELENNIKAMKITLENPKNTKIWKGFVFNTLILPALIDAENSGADISDLKTEIRTMKEENRLPIYSLYASSLLD